MEDKRLSLLNKAPVRENARYVLYWIQSNRRAENNHALNFAIEQANELKLPLLVYEELTSSSPYACDRFHQFVLENSLELATRLKKRGLRYVFNLVRTRRVRLAAMLSLAANAALLVSDDFPASVVPGNNAWVSARAGIPFFIVDSAGIVPMKEMTRQEYAARTIRPKICRLLPSYMRPLLEPVPQIDSSRLKIDYEAASLQKKSIKEWVAGCSINHRIGPSPLFKGGYSWAQQRLNDFIERKLNNYAADRNEPGVDGTSGLSPYLHFGVISPLEIALNVNAAGKNIRSSESFLEELVVRRELSYNFTRFNRDYESLGSLPRWVQQTLSDHAGDRRPYRYSCRQLENSNTHDPIWNACQLEMAATGKIHGYMRMYWGKKIIEWSGSHVEALESMIYLNNQYGLDGRNPNSWTGILWCFGLHDRPWGERSIFGKIRYMSGENLQRKIDVSRYIERVKARASSEHFFA